MEEVNKLGKILIVDDNEDVLFALNLLLEPYTEKIKVATTPDRIEHFMTTFHPDLILLDMNFSRDAISGQEGFESLKQILQLDPQAIVIFMTAYADTDKAVRAIKAGATDFIPKPWEKDKLLATLTSGMRLRQSQQEVNMLKEQVEILSGQNASENDIIGESPAMQEVFATINKLSNTDANILILGENGTGKDVIARLLYRCSPRYGKPFVTIDLGSIPEQLFESELFGYEEGSFTGAKKGGRAGKFELAHGGTIFLDEIGDLPMAMQAKLLRVLQEGEIEKVGGQKSVPIDVRVIAATNQPLEQMIEDGTFRMDLYFRLNVISIEIPPLRKRGSDVILLANEFLDTFNHKYQKEKHMKESAYQALMNYKWPGNVRELRNVVESAVVLTMSDSIGAGDLPEYISGVAAEENVQQDAQTKELSMLEDGMHFDSLKEQVEAYEKHVIAAALERCQGNRNAVIQELKVSRRTFYRKLAEYGLS